MGIPNTSRSVLSIRGSRLRLHSTTTLWLENSLYIFTPDALIPWRYCIEFTRVVMPPPSGRPRRRPNSPVNQGHITGDLGTVSYLHLGRRDTRDEDHIVIYEPPSDTPTELSADTPSQPETLPAAGQGVTGIDDADFDVEGEGAENDIEPEGIEAEGENEEEEDEEEEEAIPFDANAIGLKEISNLASFTVSSYKPGCGVKELRDDDVNQYWQSDGPQPHRLNIHFIKRVEIRALRLYLDYELDESYTPTKIQITAGTGPNLTIPFTTIELSQPKGWVDVPIAGAGGGPDGNSLCCFFVRVIILENHQNGKDTHIRGVKVYALDEGADTADNNPIDDFVGELEDYDLRMRRASPGAQDEDSLQRLDAQAQERRAKTKKYVPGDGGLAVPSFMREPEIR
ncbi:anaphase-promoting complex, subunit 10-domain-containing protein [Xylaria sp. CBS 124048]|nr:anaphase-promoting complex, subunit 10-domain-containing protein [Xylaria sp. CBS 124048]